MASITQPPLKFTGYGASDLLRSSNSGVIGIPLKALGKARLGMRRQDFVVSAKLRKVKRRERPWPADADPNVKGGILSHLSPFKPLKEKPKPVTLDFERPLIDFEKKINDVRKMAAETGLDFSDQIASLENKYQQALKDLYTHLTPIQRVNIARHPNRPTFLDHVFNITEKFVELHGDRGGYDDPAIVTGIGTINGESYMFIGQQKGRFTKENIKRNFGMPTPQGYRKALRMMYYADHHGFPIVTFIDTPGAFADLKSEELGQGEAIAHNLRTMFGLKVPIVSIVMGEGGSGGALAIGCGNKLLMLENAVFYVASPEACAAILWKSAKASPQAAEKLKITAHELCKLQIADGIIPEPLGGAHTDPAWTSQQIKAAILESMDELKQMNTEDLLKHRMLKFRKIGGFEESIPVKPHVQTPKKELAAGVEKGFPVDLIKKSDTKKKAMLLANKKSAADARKLKLTVLKAMKSSSSAAVSYLNNLVAKFKIQVDYEYSKAANAVGLTEKLQELRKEFSEAKEDPNAQRKISEKVNTLTEEFNQSLPEAPNYGTLQKKLKMLKSLSEAKDKQKATLLKQQVSNKFKEVLDRPDIKEKIESLRAEVERSGAATAEDLDPELRDKIVKTKKEIEAELTNVLGLEAAKPDKELAKVISSAPEDVKYKVGHLNEKISNKINDVMRSTEVENMVAALKLEVAKAGASPSPESKDKIMALEKEIKSRVSEAINSSELREEQEKIMGVMGSENGRVGVSV